MATDPFALRVLSRFLTGPYGMGHAVLHVEHVEPLVPFYRDCLVSGERLPGCPLMECISFHVNGRHHSFAMIGTGRRGLHHFLVSTRTWTMLARGMIWRSWMKTGLPIPLDGIQIPHDVVLC